MKRNLIVIFLISAGLSVNAQYTIKPGDPIIHPEFIKPSHDFYKNVITDTSGHIIYEFMMEDVCTVDPVGKQITFARSRQVPVGSFSTDTSVTDMMLKPVRMHEIHYQRGTSYDMVFNADNAVVVTTKKGATSEKKYAMQPGYFEDNMTEYIFGCLDLKKGTIYILNNFNPANSGNDPYTLDYAFDDTWKAAEESKINCRVLHFTHGGTTGYIWIEKTTHQMLKAVGFFKTGSYVITKH